MVTVIVGVTCTVVGFVAGWLVCSNNQKVATQVGTAVDSVKSIGS